MKDSNFVNTWNSALIDNYYTQWRNNPDSVDENWNAFFYGFEWANNEKASAVSSLEKSLDKEQSSQVLSDASKQARFTGAIYAFRSIGHTQAHFNPLLDTVRENPRLQLDRLGFSEKDLNDIYNTGNYLRGKKMSVRQLLSQLKSTYCGTIGVEYLHLQETRERRWLQSKMEPNMNKPSFSPGEKKRILEKILEAETFEKFLHEQFIGQKRFSLEGSETLISSLDAIVEHCPGLGVEEIVMGMAHRGRLTVLSTILRKSSEFIFAEFSKNYIPETMYGDGDVKYHLGYDAQVKTQKGDRIKIHLAPNPSHLESVDPIVQGSARARQRLLDDIPERKKVLPLLIHGDAAFAGQGIVSEVLNLSQLEGYTTGGTLHFIINNQIGFTTNPSEARSSLYCTDVAKIVEAPIFHVNGDDPFAVVWATKMALEYRQEFRKDSVIDMYCYRRHGHNESDEPSFTQPLLYRKIKKHPLISKTLADKMIKEDSISTQEVETIRDSYHKNFKSTFDRVKKKSDQETTSKKETSLKGSNAVFQEVYSFKKVSTEVSFESLEKIINALTTVPKNFHLNLKIKRQMEAKKKAFQEDTGLDWAAAEQLAWGTLLLEGSSVRLSGQDCSRGTFSHRHAVVYDTESYDKYIPLMGLEGLEKQKATICIHNSMLSEAAVLGFDFGYSLDYPEMLCIWEAQFGDFANGAQTIIDQFIMSSESKWQQVSGIVLLLPHGYEGQGPEHSSARLERFLQACAEDNIQVCNMTTPAQYFHVLRRQMKRKLRKPLIIMAPKSLLRHKKVISKVSDFTQETFQTLIDDDFFPGKVEQLIFCSGKIYYELIDYREKYQIKNTAIVRIEQLYPMDKKRLKKIITHHKGFKKLIWCQEESENMGAWRYIRPILEEVAEMKVFYAGRDASASPAVGSLALHEIEQEDLIKMAIG